MKNKLVHRSIIGTFVSLYLLVSIISTIHVIEFFKLSNPTWLAVSLAIAFELGAAASLASLVILEKMNKTLVWMLFGTITLMQMQGNMYYAFTHMENYQGWSELFGLIEEEVVYQKRVLSAVSGAILPLVALGFIKSLVDYIKPETQTSGKEENKPSEEIKMEEIPVEPKKDNFSYSSEELEEAKEWDATLEDGLKDETEVKEITEEKDEDHELDLALNQMVEEMEIPSEEPESRPSDFIGGYYGDIPVDGDIVIDGGKGPSVQIEESQMLPVNSNVPTQQKNTGIIDNAGSVHLNPMKL
jgi:uncharacterized membrane protein